MGVPDHVTGTASPEREPNRATVAKTSSTGVMATILCKEVWGDDTLYGGDGGDVLLGGGDNDDIKGGDDRDFLIGLRSNHSPSIVLSPNTQQSPRALSSIHWFSRCLSLSQRSPNLTYACPACLGHSSAKRRDAGGRRGLEI